jgi:hypothetical protein
MSNTPKEVTVNFRIEDIYVTEFSLHEDYQRYPFETLGMTVSHHINVTSETSAAKVTIKVLFFEKEKEIALATLSCTSTFGIESISQFQVGTALILPEPFLITIASVSFTHTRAILSQYANGYFMMPMINPVEYFGESIRGAIENIGEK